MPATDTIKEFLVGLGFKVDQDGLKKFEAGVGKATSTVMGLGTAAAAAGVAIEAMVIKASNQMEDLYYTSARSGASINNLQAFGYAAGQVGVDAGAARAAVESMASAMRLNPGLEQVMKGIGVQTRDANGQLKDSEKMFTDLIGRLKEMGPPGSMGFALASRYAQMFGIDPNMLLQLEQGYDKLKKAQDDYAARQKAAGVDSDATKQDWLEFSNALEKLESDFGILGQRISHDFLEPAKWVVESIDSMVQWFTRLDHATEDWTKNLTGVKITLGEVSTVFATMAGGLTLKGIVSKLLGSGGVAAGEGAAAGGVAAAAGASAATSAAEGAAVKGALTVAAETAGKATATGIVGGIVARVAGPLGLAYAILKPTAANEGEDADLAARRALGGGLDVKLSKDHHELDERALAYYQSKGWSAEQAAGIVANLKKESSLNQESVGDYNKKTGEYDAYGLGQWRKDRQEAFRKFAGHDIHQSTFDEQLAFVDYELKHGEKKAGDDLKRTGRASNAGEILSREYERPKDKDGAARDRGELADALFGKYKNVTPFDESSFIHAPDMGRSLMAPTNVAPAFQPVIPSQGSPLAPTPAQTQNMGNVSVDQKTEITILGGPDANATAKKVVDEQNRVNGNLVRMVSGSVQ